MKVAVGYPCSWAGVPVPFSDSLMNLNQTFLGNWIRSSGNNPAEMRNIIAERFLSTDCTHLALMDADGIIPSNAIIDLLETRKEIVSGIQWSHGPEYFLSAFDRVDAYKGRPIPPPITEVRQVYATGFQLMLIERDVFEKLDFPWFEIKYRGDTPDTRVTADLWFCEKCYQAGIPIFVNPHVKIPHLTDGMVTFELVTQAPVFIQVPKNV